MSARLEKSSAMVENHAQHVEHIPRPASTVKPHAPDSSASPPQPAVDLTPIHRHPLQAGSHQTVTIRRDRLIRLRTRISVEDWVYMRDNPTCIRTRQTQTHTPPPHQAATRLQINVVLFLHPLMGVIPTRTLRMVPTPSHDFPSLLIEEESRARHSKIELGQTPHLPGMETPRDAHSLPSQIYILPTGGLDMRPIITAPSTSHL